MRIVFLGTEGYHPSDRGQTSCVFVPEAGLALDAGTGIYRLGRHLRTRTLDIALSHAHLDHVAGLTYLLGVLWGRETPVTVHGSVETLDAVAAHLFAPRIFPVPPPFELRKLEGEIAVGGDGRMHAFPLPGHPGGSLGFRVDWPGGSLAYVTDCVADPQADYVEAVRGVDLLIHECNFPDRLAEHAGPTGHSHTTPVAEVARAAGVGRLLLTHLNPAIEGPDPVGLEAARAIFAATDVARDGAEWDL